MSHVHVCVLGEHSESTPCACACGVTTKASPGGFGAARLPLTHASGQWAEEDGAPPRFTDKDYRDALWVIATEAYGGAHAAEGQVATNACIHILHVCRQLGVEPVP